jgi:hypothetical protein
MLEPVSSCHEEASLGAIMILKAKERKKNKEQERVL